MSYLTEKEAADHVRLNPKTLRNYRNTGGGPAFIKIGGGSRIVYETEALDAWMASHRVKSTSEAATA